MIKFFRKIRQNLLNEGKTTKYLKYAIGKVAFDIKDLLGTPNFKTKNELLPSWEGTEGWVLRLEKNITNPICPPWKNS